MLEAAFHQNGTEHLQPLSMQYVGDAPVRCKYGPPPSKWVPQVRCAHSVSQNFVTLPLDETCPCSFPRSPPFSSSSEYVRDRGSWQMEQVKITSEGRINKGCVSPGEAAVPATMSGIFGMESLAEHSYLVRVLLAWTKCHKSPDGGISTIAKLIYQAEKTITDQQILSTLNDSGRSALHIVIKSIC